MSIKSKVLATAAALTMVGGVGVAGALTAGTATAATPSCGSSCINVFNRSFSTHSNPSFVQDVLRQGEKLGQPIILFRQSNADPAEDFSVSYTGQVSQLYTSGLVGAAVALHYGGGCANWVMTPGNPNANPPVPSSSTCTAYFPNDFAFEVQYAPYGVDSGLCVGVPTTAYQDEKVSLQPCGVSGRTVWIQDVANATGWFGSYAPYINGSDTNFSNPYVLDYPATSYPTDMPRPQLIVNELALNQNGNVVNDTQEWAETFGVLR